MTEFSDYERILIEQEQEEHEVRNGLLALLGWSGALLVGALVWVSLFYWACGGK
jgi:hypothetical protein